MLHISFLWRFPLIFARLYFNETFAIRMVWHFVSVRRFLRWLLCHFRWHCRCYDKIFCRCWLTLFCQNVLSAMAMATNVDMALWIATMGTSCKCDKTKSMTNICQSDLVEIWAAWCHHIFECTYIEKGSRRRKIW